MAGSDVATRTSRASAARTIATGPRPGHEARRAVEQRGAEPGRAQADDADGNAAEPDPQAHTPEVDEAGADQGGDGRSQGHGVVGVDDPGHVAEDDGRDDEPAAPEQVAGEGTVGPVGPAAPEQTDDQAHDRQRNEPRDLAEHLVVEEPQQTDVAAEPAATGHRRPRRARWRRRCGRGRRSRRSGPAAIRSCCRR